VDGGGGGTRESGGGWGAAGWEQVRIEDTKPLRAELAAYALGKSSGVVPHVVRADVIPRQVGGLQIEKLRGGAGPEAHSQQIGSGGMIVDFGGHHRANDECVDGAFRPEVEDDIYAVVRQHPIGDGRDAHIDSAG